MRRCAICKKYIVTHFWVCGKCYQEWELKGKSPKEWPKWIRALVTIEQRNERYDKNVQTVPLREDY